jgi:hypothetical protein
MRAMVIQSDFTGGELDPKLYGRVSIPRYQSGLATAKNVDIMVTGGATRRAGTRFVCNAGAGVTVRQLPFVLFRTDTTPASLKGYVVEFRSDDKLRFYVDGAVIGAPYELATPFPGANLSLIKYEQFNSGLYLVHPDFPPQILKRTSDTSWTCSAAPFTFNTPQALFGTFFTERANPKNIPLNSVCSSGTQFVAVGNADTSGDAYLLNSVDGITWTERTNPKNFALWSVCWSGTQFVAVGAADGTDAYIITSPDGITWTERANPKNFALYSVTWSGSQFVACGAADGTNSYLLTSPDGITWTEQSPTVAKNVGLSSVCWSGSQFVAVGVADGTDGYILTSSDGITWTERSDPSNFALKSVCWSGTQFVAVGVADGTNAYLITSPDGVTWTEQVNPKNLTLNSVVWSGTQFVSVGGSDGVDSYIITSTDGITWNERTNPKSFILNSICWSGSQFIAVGDTITFIIVSAGVIWSERANPKNFAVNSVCWNGTQFVAVGVADGTNAYLITSPDGVTWTEQVNPKNFALNSVIWNGTQFVAVGAADGTDAYIVTSPDGITWTERANPNNYTLSAIVWTGAKFLACGSRYIITSSDGIVWTRSFDPALTVYGVCWSGTQFVVVGGTAGTAYVGTSPDGITWSSQYPVGSKNFILYAICWNGTQFVAVGAADGTDAYIVTSPDGITWTERANPKNYDLKAIIWTGTQYIAVGVADGTNAYFIASPDGITWTERTNPKNFALNSVCWSGTQFVAVGAADGTDGYILTSGMLTTGEDAYILTATLPVQTEGITLSGSTATATTTTPHGLKTGNLVTITGALPGEYDGTFQVTVVDDYTFTYPVTGSPVSPATGTITMARVPWGTTGYPSAITFFEQRLILARTKTHPQTIWGSETNNLSNFVLGVYDSSPFEFVPSAAASSINQLISTTQVVALTNDKEITMSGGSGLPLTPSNVQIKAVGRYGSKDGIRPLPIGTELIFATRSGKRIRGMAYELIKDSYNFPNVCIMSEHLLESGIIEMFHASEPQSTVYILTMDGNIARVAYDREQEVVAFSRYETDGLFKGICVVQEGLKDQIYVTVQRTINGTTNTYVELFDPDLNTDCAITGTDGPGKTTWNLGPTLEGEIVDVVADGVSVGPLTVTSGQIVLSAPAHNIEVGLHFDSEIYDLKPEVQTGDGTAQGRTSASVNEITVRLNNSRGCTINDKPVMPGTTAFSGDKKVSELGWGGGRVQVKQTLPYPFTVLAIIKRLTVND